MKNTRMAIFGISLALYFVCLVVQKFHIDKTQPVVPSGCADPLMIEQFTHMDSNKTDAMYRCDDGEWMMYVWEPNTPKKFTEPEPVCIDPQFISWQPNDDGAIYSYECDHGVTMTTTTPLAESDAQ